MMTIGSRNCRPHPQGKVQSERLLPLYEQFKIVLVAEKLGQTGNQCDSSRATRVRSAAFLIPVFCFCPLASVLRPLFSAFSLFPKIDAAHFPAHTARHARWDKIFWSCHAAMWPTSTPDGTPSNPWTKSCTSEGGNQDAPSRTSISVAGKTAGCTDFIRGNRLAGHCSGRTNCPSPKADNFSRAHTPSTSGNPGLASALIPSNTQLSTIN